MVTLNITKDNFKNGFFEAENEKGCVVTFNAVEERWLFKDVLSQVNEINIGISQDTGEATLKMRVPNIIGMGSRFVGIRSEYSRLLGTNLSLDNVDKCTIEIYDEELSDA